MSANEPVAAAAEALFEELCPGIRYTETDRLYYEEAVRAVLRSLREPTDEMIVAMEIDADSEDVEDGSLAKAVADTWRVGIDVLLERKDA